MTENNAVDRFFDALANRDLDAVGDTLAADALVWHGFDGIAHDREAILASFVALFGLFEQILFYDVRQQPTPTGYVRQHVMSAKTADGRAIAWPVCAVVQIKDGLIVRLDEYLDRAGSFVPKDDDVLTPGF